jgi:acyl-CoA thioester hydrolase
MYFKGIHSFQQKAKIENMYGTSVKLRIRYAETDKMGYCYYGNYAQFFEVARVELLRELGIVYRELENEGIILPVTHFSIDYFKPAFYDDLIEVKCDLKELPKSSIEFFYTTTNAQGETLNKSTTKLVFYSTSMAKAVRPPQSLIERLKPYFV